MNLRYYFGANFGVEVSTYLDGKFLKLSRKAKKKERKRAIIKESVGKVISIHKS